MKWATGLVTLILGVLTIVEKVKGLRRDDDQPGRSGPSRKRATRPSKQREPEERRPGITDQLWRMTVVLLMVSGATFIFLVVYDWVE